MSNVIELHRAALDEFGRRVHGVPSGAWHQPTPCPSWDVAELVNHVVGENRWATPLFGGATIADVGDRLDGDLLGDDPVATWDDSAAEAAGGTDGVALDATVHLSFGDVPAEEYLWQLTADALVHSWDLARATGQDERLEESLVAATATWFDDREELYRAAGAIGPAVAAPDDEPVSNFLGRWGRDTSADEPLAVIGRFNRAFNDHDLEAIRAMITEDCVFVDTTPPRGGTHSGAAAVIEAFGNLFADSPNAYFETLGGFVGDSRAAFRWLYRWGDGESDCIEGIDLFTCRDGRVAAKLAYVKG